MGDGMFVLFKKLEIFLSFLYKKNNLKLADSMGVDENEQRKKEI